MNDKLKENKILLSANNKLQEKVDALAKKLGGIKMKICERLNDANADAETEIIEVLTEIVMSMETD